MKHFSSLKDISSPQYLIEEALMLKDSPYKFDQLGKGKTLLMLFFNSSLRTRLSTEKAALQLGMDVITLNVNDAWKLELEDGTTMNLDTSEHIKEAAQVVSQYADIIAVRAFPGLENRKEDEKEIVINSFKKYASIPLVNLESSTTAPMRH